MKTVTINNFGGGKALDKYSGISNEFSDSRNFDIFTYPNRLYPLPSMIDTTVTNSKIGNLITAKNSAGSGYIIGLGANVAGSNLYANTLWKFGGTAWTQISTKLSLSVQNYDLFLEYNYGQTRTIVTADNDSVAMYDVTDAVAPGDSPTTIHSLSYTTLTQGIVHPKNNILYFGYDNHIGSNNVGTWSDAVLTLPSKYTVVSVAPFGDYLAIGCTAYVVGGIPQSDIYASVVYLWDMVSTTWQDRIIWGDNQLKLINNLNGVLVGVSTVPANENAQLLIKGYAGGQPEVLKKIIANIFPTITVYPRVNIIHRNQLVFSAKITENGTTTHNGLWSFGKINGQWSLTLSQFASTDGTDKDVLAACFYLGSLSTVHTAVGTTTYQLSTGTNSTDYASTSYYESLVNPGMSDFDKTIPKVLQSVTCHYLPLPTTGQVIMKYRVDGSDWITIFTETTDNAVNTKRTKPASGQFRNGYNYEFRIESTGFAQITGFTYTYQEKTR